MLFDPRQCRDCGATHATTEWWAAVDWCSACAAEQSSEALRGMARRCAELRSYLATHRGSYLSVADELDRLRHARHRWWRRRRAAHRVASWAYQVGLVSGSGTVYGPHCHGCLTHIGWRGRRPYVLGWTRERWHCLLVGHHLRAEIPGTWLCAKCAPCPCGSTAPAHDAWRCLSSETAP